MFTVLFYLIFLVSSLYYEGQYLFNRKYIIPLMSNFNSSINEEFLEDLHTNGVFNNSKLMTQLGMTIASLFYVVFNIIGIFSSLSFLFIILFLLDVIKYLFFKNNKIYDRIDNILSIVVILTIMFMKFGL